MGNIQTTYNSNQIENIINQFILSQKISKLKLFTNLNECSKITKLFKNILKSNLSNEQIIQLYYKITGESVTKTTSNVCNTISKFYVKIGHIFAVIMIAVNPVISYKDKGKTKHTSIFNRDKISKKDLILESNDNMCDNYVNILKNITNKGRSQTKCNKNAYLKTLKEFSEFDILYFDKYNKKTGKFDCMTERSTSLYRKDLETFYKIFTGESNLPTNIKKFTDIPFSSYCKDDINIDSLIKSLDTTDDEFKEMLFREYALKIREIAQLSNKCKEELLNNV